jgi:transcriptional regulator with GAF, ATPase, and Fis domain
MRTDENLLIRTLVELADNLVDDFDVVDLLTLLADRCVEVLDVAAAGVMLAAPSGALQVVASSSEAMRVLELFELQADQGPCVDCYATGEPVVNVDLAAADTRWSRFASEAVAAGFGSVHALPLRLRGRTIGALNMFRADQGTLDASDVSAAQGLADIATIAIIQHQVAVDAQTPQPPAQRGPQQPGRDRASQRQDQPGHQHRHGPRLPTLTRPRPQP